MIMISMQNKISYSKFEAIELFSPLSYRKTFEITHRSISLDEVGKRLYLLHYGYIKVLGKEYPPKSGIDYVYYEMNGKEVVSIIENFLQNY